MQKATFEVLMARKEQAKDKTEFKEVELQTLGLAFTVRKLPLSRVINLVGSSVNTMDDMGEALEVYKELIYNSVPIFQSEKLQAAYDLAEPMDIVTEVLEDNIMAIAELAGAIVAMYGIDTGEALAQLKN